ncbi:hypothetical protein [Pasteurella testudinis]
MKISDVVDEMSWGSFIAIVILPFIFWFTIASIYAQDKKLEYEKK